MGLKYIDEYDFRARYVPAVIALYPLFLTSVLLFPGIKSLIAAPSLGVVLVLFLVRIARDEGKKIEAGLFAEWDGMPTTRFLRHRNKEMEAPTRDRIRSVLSKLTRVELPDVEQETRDPSLADEHYAAAVTALRRLRPKKTFPLVFSENCNYGMIRNLLGLKSTGIILAVLCLAISAAALVVPFGSHDGAIAALIICGVQLAGLLRFATKPAVKRAAEAYALAILTTCQPSPRAIKPS